MPAVPHRGPYVVLDPEEKKYLAKVLDRDDSPVAGRILDKIAIALGSDPRFRTPGADIIVPKK